MKTTRHRYHYSVRWCKKNKQQIQRTKLAENIRNSDTFWGELRKINPVSKQISETIGTAQGSSEISKLFFHKYKSLYNSVPTSDSEMTEVCDALHDNLLTCDESLIHRVTPDIMALCISKLKSGKSDGNKGFTSDDLHNSGKRLNILLSLLFKSILFHGYSPHELLLSTIVSIPKDVKSSLSSADNYRGISLFNSIAKVFDYVLIELFGGSLQTYDMQFAYKAKHSTTLCTMVYLETLHHYVNNGSNVYSCLLDASKAFDRIHYGKLFTILLSKQVPAFIIRYLLDSYIRQMSRALWDTCCSAYFSMSNGVKHGGVLSAILFTIYIDKLLCKLKRSELGCRMGNSYVGALSYADDITLLCPSIRGLNKMLDICNSFADMYDIKFNAKKSLGIKFGGQQVMSEVLYLGNSRIEWVSSVKHLGNYVNCDMTDKTDCDMKCFSFIGYVNKLKANFGYLQPFVLGNLFKTFCCSFYGSPLWGFNSLSFKKICTTWNIGVRSIFNLPYRAHTYFLGPLLQQPHISEQLYIRSAQFLYNMYNSHNSIVQTCFKNALYNSNSVIGLKIAYFRARYRVNFTTSTRSTIMSSIRVTVPTEDQTVSINHLFSLLSARSDLSFIEGFNLVEIIEMIDYVSTS